MPSIVDMKIKELLFPKVTPIAIELLDRARAGKSKQDKK